MNISWTAEEDTGFGNSGMDSDASNALSISASLRVVLDVRLCAGNEIDGSVFKCFDDPNGAGGAGATD